MESGRYACGMGEPAGIPGYEGIVWVQRTFEVPVMGW